MKSILNYLPLLTLLLFLSHPNWAQVIRVQGTVRNHSTKQPISDVTIGIEGTSSGTSTNEQGYFELTGNFIGKRLVFTMVGFEKVIQAISPSSGYVDVLLYQVPQSLNEVSVHAGKSPRYRNKDNPAVDLIRKVIEHKEGNRSQQNDYVEYETYEKLQLSVSNTEQRVSKSPLLKKYRFMMSLADSGELEKRLLLPFYLQEKIYQSYYRKNPEQQKEIMLAEKKTRIEKFVDNDGLTQYLDNIYQDIDIYENNIPFAKQQFLSPLASTAPTFYKYFIIDTINTVQGQTVALMFSPRNKADMLFKGTMHIPLNGQYPVSYLELSVSKDINLNWVRALDIKLHFEMDANKKYYKSQSSIQMDMGVFKGRGGIFGSRTVSIKNYKVGVRHPDSMYSGRSEVITQGAYNRSDSFWIDNRHQQLSSLESSTYQVIDTLQKFRPFRRTMDIATLLLSGYKVIGPVEIGPLNTFYSFNPTEGFRPRIGGRTTDEWSKKLFLEGHIAYGTRDKRWKYAMGATLSLSQRSIYEFPVRSLSIQYSNETQIPGQQLAFLEEDNFLLSFKRGINDKLLYNRIFKVEYKHETDLNLSFKVAFRHWDQEPGGILSFRRLENGKEQIESSLQVSELSGELRWAPNEQFYQGKRFRRPIFNRYPIFTVRGTLGIKGLFGGAHTYQSVSLNVFKRVYLSQFGYTDVVAEGGYIFGRLPFPLLTIHRANQSFAYQLESYNLMNFMEFISDHYVSLSLDHSLNGFIFNKIPIFKKLRLRETMSFKLLYGGLRNENLPGQQDGAMPFPKDIHGRAISHVLDRGPYMELSFGVSNIFKLLRVDMVRRLNYLAHPNVSSWGLRARVRLDF